MQKDFFSIALDYIVIFVLTLSPPVLKKKFNCGKTVKKKSVSGREALSHK